MQRHWQNFTFQRVVSSTVSASKIQSKTKFTTKSCLKAASIYARVQLVSFHFEVSARKLQEAVKFNTAMSFGWRISLRKEYPSTEWQFLFSAFWFPEVFWSWWNDKRKSFWHKNLSVTFTRWSFMANSYKWRSYRRMTKTSCAIKKIWFTTVLSDPANWKYLSSHLTIKSWRKGKRIWMKQF